MKYLFMLIALIIALAARQAATESTTVGFIDQMTIEGWVRN